ncbi:MAG: flagellar biosynthetic protein FliQ [Bryobacteraceae bacterium]
MNAATVTEAMRQAMMTAFWLALPLLALGFLAGLVMSLVQIVTSIQDPGFAAVPRLAAFFAGLLLCLPWMLMKLTAYTTALFADLGRYAH